MLGTVTGETDEPVLAGAEAVVVAGAGEDAVDEEPAPAFEKTEACQLLPHIWPELPKRMY
jgi:hypothetical protein